MTSDTLTAEQVAEFLAANPDFFNRHAEVFHTLQVAHPENSKTISLAQRQLMALRSRVTELEDYIRQISFYALENQELGETLTDWCVAMLAEKDTQCLPEVTRDYLEQAFPELKVAIRLWGDVDSQEFRCDDADLQGQIGQMQRVYTGSSVHENIAAWFEAPPASVAILPLRKAEGCFGALVFAAEDSGHFSEDMSHTFLVMVSALCSAALSRMAKAPVEAEEPAETEKLAEPEE